MRSGVAARVDGTGQVGLKDSINVLWICLREQTAERASRSVNQHVETTNARLTNIMSKLIGKIK